jgi:hypothetical protein
MSRARFWRRRCHRSLGSLCRKRLATTRQAIQIFLQALGEKPADCDNERHDHDEDDDCYRPRPLVSSSLHRTRPSVMLALSAVC